jgi:sulfatase maturation enzyme AslB (radical SAM superfamily)
MKHYCPLPFINIYSELNGFDPCCTWKRINNDDTILDVNEAFNGVKIKQIRQDMIDGKEIPNCEYCYNDEKIGQKSFRQEAIDKWGVVTVPNLQYLDVVFDNICNLKCRGCNSTASHQWYDEEIQIYGKPFVEKKYIRNPNLHTMDATNLKHIRISGGEPFFSKDCDHFLKNLRDNNLLKNIDLTFATNCTIIPNSSFHQSLLECNDLTVVLSIDGIGSLNDYIRSPSTWDTCVETMNYFNELIDLRTGKNTNIAFRTTVYIYNVNKLKEIDLFFKQTFPRFTESKKHVSVEPTMLSIKNMPQDLKELVRASVEEYSEVLGMLDQPGENLFEDFLFFHNTLDFSRKEKLGEANSLLSDYINNQQSVSNNYLDGEKVFSCIVSEITKAG